MAGKTPEADITKLRETRAALLAELEGLDGAELPPDEWRSRAHAWLDRMAEQGESLFAYGLRGARSTEYHQPRVNALEIAVARGGHALASVDLGAFAALLLRDALRDRIDRTIAAESYDYGLPLAERPRRRAKLEDQIHAIEVREELLIRAAQGDGVTIQRRADAKPELVLAWQDELEQLAKERKA